MLLDIQTPLESLNPPKKFSPTEYLWAEIALLEALLSIVDLNASIPFFVVLADGSIDERGVLQYSHTLLERGTLGAPPSDMWGVFDYMLRAHKRTSVNNIENIKEQLWDIHARKKCEFLEKTVGNQAMHILQS